MDAPGKKDSDLGAIIRSGRGRGRARGPPLTEEQLRDRVRARLAAHGGGFGGRASWRGNRFIGTLPPIPLGPTIAAGLQSREVRPTISDPPGQQGCPRPSTSAVPDLAEGDEVAPAAPISDGGPRREMTRGEGTSTSDKTTSQDWTIPAPDYDDGCWICGGPHTHRQCRVERPPGFVYCFLCGKHGFTKANCPSKKCAAKFFIKHYPEALPKVDNCKRNEDVMPQVREPEPHLEGEVEEEMDVMPQVREPEPHLEGEVEEEMDVLPQVREPEPHLDGGGNGEEAVGEMPSASEFGSEQEEGPAEPAPMEIAREVADLVWAIWEDPGRPQFVRLTFEVDFQEDQLTFRYRRQDQ